MSTVQNAVTAEAGDSSATIRARVGDSAIDKVTRLFSASLADIFTETLQNSRRGGASRVAATIEQDGDTTRVTLIDDGAGIADPAVLLTFGESGWKAGIAEAEDPAGFGLLALSRRGLHFALARPLPGPKLRIPLGAGARSLSRPRCGACRPGRQRPLAAWNRGHFRGIRGASLRPRFSRDRRAALPPAGHHRRGDRRAPRFPRWRAPCRAMERTRLRRFQGQPCGLPRPRRQLPLA